jgi:hypothetical protein
MVPAVAQVVQRLKAAAMAWAPSLGKTDRRTWTPLGFAADEADFNITLPTMDDKSSCLGTIRSSAA